MNNSKPTTRSDSAESLVTIDEHNLDRECIRLPGDYLKYATRSAEAKRDMDEVKAKIEVAKAKLAKQIREQPGDYGIEKITESAIAGATSLDESVQEIEHELIQARFECDKLQAVVWALEHKKRSLTLMVDLHGMGYFSAPKITENGRKAVEEMTQRKVRRHRED